MAIAAIEAVAPDMPFVAELDGLLPRLVGSRDVRRTAETVSMIRAMLFALG
jgi:hypothetical protein